MPPEKPKMTVEVSVEKPATFWASVTQKELL